MTYSDFLAKKRATVPPSGREITTAECDPMLHPWQAEIVQWACRVGRAAVWADTGLGKTIMQVQWAKFMGDTSLILAPLAVTAQTIREAAKVGVDAKYVRHHEEITGPGVWITNYEMVDHFEPEALDALVLDEASILKQSDGKTRTKLIEFGKPIPYKLSCTATPAPNDPEELTNQAEFLGHMSRTHMLAAYFIHDSDGWRLKGHARKPMMQWMGTWALAVRKPSDMGYDDAGYTLPGLEIIPQLLPVDIKPDDQLVATDLGGVGGRAQVRRATLDARVARTLELVQAEPDDAWILWCGLNDEANALAKAIPGSVNIHGSMSPEQKAEGLLGFADGKFKILIVKPSIASQGLNYQHCARMAFVGLSDSYETYYQAIRRCYRYGQHRVVHAHVVLSELEGQIATNVARKEIEASQLTQSLVREMQRARLHESETA